MNCIEASFKVRLKTAYPVSLSTEGKGRFHWGISEEYDTFLSDFLRYLRTVIALTSLRLFARQREGKDQN